MSSKPNISWNERFALIEHFKPKDDQICQAFGITQNELDVAREMKQAGTFSTARNVDVNRYGKLFGVEPTPKSATTHTKPTPTDVPATATKRSVRSPKKRGRQGDKILKAFSSVPAEPVTVESFMVEHNVSLAVLRQPKRFDTTGIEGDVKVRKDRETKELMIWREPAK